MAHSQNEERVGVDTPRRLGRMPAKASRRALQFVDFFKYLKLPTSTNFWTRRAQIPVRDFGNLQIGDCTRAKQAVAAMRMERIEQKRTIEISDDEVRRVYFEMTDRLYGGGDTGAYEDDALSCWRSPETTFKDTKGNPYTIDAYLRLNATNHDEVKAALALASAKGIAVCFNLPLAWSTEDHRWDVAPVGTPLIGPWMPGSWGGHSMWCYDYTAEGIWCDHTWGIAPVLCTWEAAAIYMDEAHVVLDSVDAWRALSKGSKVGKLKVADVVDAVRAASSIPIASLAQ